MKKHLTNMDKYDTLIEKLMESEATQKLYKDYVIKDITFREWVIGMVDNTYGTTM